MNNEKSEKIKKDIEICMKSLTCENCSHHSSRSGECCRNLTNDVLTLINELEKENATKTDTIIDLLKKQEFYEREKLKQFAEKLENGIDNLDIILHEDNDEEYVSINQLLKFIDETLKKFLGEEQ